MPASTECSATPVTADQALTVYFDGACPLCRREIAWYRRRPGAERICWTDVSAAPPGTVAPGLAREAAMARFHVRLADGTLVSGGRAFAELWARLPGFALAGRLLRRRPLALLLEAAYRLFLPVRPYLQRLAGARRG